MVGYCKVCKVCYGLMDRGKVPLDPMAALDSAIQEPRSQPFH